MDVTTILAILTITSILVFILNLFCIAVILRNRKLRQRPSSILTANLLTMHLLQAVFVMPFYTVKRASVTQSPFVCDGFRLFYMMTFYVACYSVLLISLDRLLAFRLKTKYRGIVTFPRVLVTLAAVWTYIVGLCTIPFGYPTEKCRYNPQPSWVVFMLIGNCFLPCIIVIIIYTYITLGLRKYKRISTEKPPLAENTTKLASPRNVQISHSNKKITRNTMILVLTYGIAWTPSILYYIIQSLFPDTFTSAYYDSELEQYVSFFLKYFKFVEGITSPVLYCYLNSYFRKTVLNLCCCNNRISAEVQPEMTEINSVV